MLPPSQISVSTYDDTLLPTPYHLLSPDLDIPPDMLRVFSVDILGRETFSGTPTSSFGPLLALAGVLIVWILKFAVTVSLRRRKMPPGPPGVPLLGNIFDVPGSMPWYKFTEWKSIYGTLIFATPLLVLNVSHF